MLVEIHGSCFPNVSINKIKLGISLLGCQSFGGILTVLENLEVGRLWVLWWFVERGVGRAGWMAYAREREQARTLAGRRLKVWIYRGPGGSLGCSLFQCRCGFNRGRQAQGRPVMKREAWSPVTVLPLASCVTLSKSQNCAGPQMCTHRRVPFQFKYFKASFYIIWSCLVFCVWATRK